MLGTLTFLTCECCSSYPNLEEKLDEIQAGLGVRAFPPIAGEGEMVRTDDEQHHVPMFDPLARGDAEDMYKMLSIPRTTTRLPTYRKIPELPSLHWITMRIWQCMS